MAVCGKITPQGRIFIILLLRFNTGQRLTFLSEFDADLSRYKEMRVHCTRYQKTIALFTVILRPFCLKRRNFNT